MNNVENKVIENWNKPEVFKKLKPKDLIGEKEVVSEAFSLKGNGTSSIWTLQRVKPGIVKVKNYFFDNGKLRNHSEIEHWSNSQDIGYNPEAKADQALYDGEDSFLREVGL